MLTLHKPTDALVQDLLGSSQERLQHLVQEAEGSARSFYEAKLGKSLSIEEAIAHIFEEVTTKGDEAVAAFNQAFDGGSMPAERLILGKDDLAKAWNESDDELQAALTLASENIRRYQEQLLPKSFGLEAPAELGARWSPVERVGAYVPGGAGGSLPLCSSVLMNLIPAKVAGVENCFLATPSQRDGSIHPSLSAAAHLAEVNGIYRAGGIQGIAALACGTQSLPKVDSIVGPGNIFVTMAKRYAYGRVALDMLAGPSEVLVIADDSTNAAWAAADALSQAEHDALAMSIIVCVGKAPAEAIRAEMIKQLDELPEERQATARASVERFGLMIVCETRDEAVEVSNKFAPEHLEILCENPEELVPQLRHAGAIFVGPYSPEPIGDYVAGPSHTLPTCGTARMWSGIGADIFLRRSSIIRYSKERFLDEAERAMCLARREGLEAHARSIEIRLK